MIDKIHFGNCFDIMPLIPDKSIDLILCDLPYGTTQNKWDSILPLDKLWIEYRRLLKPNGTIVLTAAQPFTSVLVCSNLCMFKYEWIWKKTDSTNYLNAKHQPLRIHESVLVFYNKNIYNAQGLKPFNKLVKDGKLVTTENYGATKGEQYKQQFTNYPESVITFSSANNTIHPTQKPVDLFRYLIRTYSNRGAVCMDNCMGSGTTAEACILEDRRFIGIENWDKMYNKSIRRVENVRYIESTKLFKYEHFEQTTLL